MRIDIPGKTYSRDETTPPEPPPGRSRRHVCEWSRLPVRFVVDTETTRPDRRIVHDFVYQCATCLKCRASSIPINAPIGTNGLSVEFEIGRPFDDLLDPTSVPDWKGWTVQFDDDKGSASFWINNHDKHPLTFLPLLPEDDET